MASLAELILQSGRAAVELALFVLLPVMVVMLSLMRLMEARNILDRLVNFIAPALRPLGIPGLGVFAMIQVLFVSFAAPMATLAMMDRGGTSRRHIAVTLAMVLSMAQANVVFPMAALGLHVGWTMLIATFGGLVAAATTYYLFGRNLPDHEELEEPHPKHPVAEDTKGILAVINRAGAEAFKIAVGSIPMLVLALLLVNILRSSGAVGLLENLFAPILQQLDVAPSMVLPLVTKLIAGGTAMMGVMVDFIDNGLITMTEFNRLAGLLISPLDIAGVAILISAGPRVAAVLKPALYGALTAVLVRTVAHLLIL
ncbi:MAG: nucleoside recognition family protein [Gammaproteobacteria bacterium]|nr:nucleoside recognition family protein [Gammaproteobacteria bacterium]